jgi:hypothetical protein
LLVCGGRISHDDEVLVGQAEKFRNRWLSLEPIERSHINRAIRWDRINLPVKAKVSDNMKAADYVFQRFEHVAILVGYGNLPNVEEIDPAIGR